MSRRPDRNEKLLEAGLALSSELSLDAVLQRIVELAARLGRRVLVCHTMRSDHFPLLRKSAGGCWKRICA